MPGFTKLFSSIITSTIWSEDDKTRLVWITMLATADRRGVVEGSVPGLAVIARVTTEECRAALIKLTLPDLDSRTKTNEGRRIKETDGGWVLLNYAKYRAKLSADERREYQREWDRVNRGKSDTNTTLYDKSDTIRLNPTHADADADAEAKNKERERGGRLHGIPSKVETVIEFGKTLNPVVEESVCRDFFAHYEGQRGTNPSGQIFWKTGSDTVLTNWQSRLPSFVGNGRMRGEKLKIQKPDHSKGF